MFTTQTPVLARLAAKPLSPGDGTDAAGGGGAVVGGGVVVVVVVGGSVVVVGGSVVVAVAGAVVVVAGAVVVVVVVAVVVVGLAVVEVRRARLVWVARPEPPPQPVNAVKEITSAAVAYHQRRVEREAMADILDDFR